MWREWDFLMGIIFFFFSAVPIRSWHLILIPSTFMAVFVMCIGHERSFDCALCHIFYFRAFILFLLLSRLFSIEAIGFIYAHTGSYFYRV